MKNTINEAIKELECNNIFDFEATDGLLAIYKNLYDRISSDVFGVCKVCYEIPTRDSYCNCKIPLDEISGNGMTRAELMVFIDLYESTEKNSIRKI